MRKTLRFILLGLLALVLTAVIAVVLIVKLVLAPAAGEWSTRVELGPMATEVSVPTVLRLATSPWFAAHLAGHAVDMGHGRVVFGWRESAQALELRCAPCNVSVPAFGAQAVRVEALTATARRDGNVFAGQFQVQPQADGAEPLQAQWSGRLSQTHLQIDFDAKEAAIAQWYRALVPQLSELQRARIGGTLALRGRLTLPEASFSALQPQIAGFTVDGLGTQALLNAHTSCGPSARLTQDSWLARAVIAAEDQRYTTHPGYDLTELLAAADANQKRGKVERGGSTLTQQLAKMVMTGSDRTAERKLRELLYAVEMEQTLGKARILELYLDSAPWGSGVCGAEAAARLYFKRSARTLEPAQAVWLAAMLNKPSAAADEWKRTGTLDAARIQWVASGIRGISRSQREALLKSVAAARFAAP
ncbi:biosynthetic peptidoglycan transglycosylase [Variovorax ginsengisoli]|uniref:Glycosyl transferase family 51 domain-containing protein n=1 Tax=Variovorax ginsengisoli TaxID=363844 RepID=A0ABT9S5P8_9BURK|nr:biosynthetic peptidoglycan transglycosylase [Variovorax ginsengisoli]MDP9899683.1 hypothetical protein [Variovorax ginsengisoli]